MSVVAQTSQLLRKLVSCCAKTSVVAQMGQLLRKRVSCCAKGLLVAQRGQLLRKRISCCAKGAIVAQRAQFLHKGIWCCAKSSLVAHGVCVYPQSVDAREGSSFRSTAVLTVLMTNVMWWSGKVYGGERLRNKGNKSPTLPCADEDGLRQQRQVLLRCRKSNTSYYSYRCCLQRRFQRRFQRPSS